MFIRSLSLFLVLSFAYAEKANSYQLIIKGLTYPANGFYTEEEGVAGKRVGFIMKTLDGGQGYLAHQAQKSDFHIRRFGVSIDNIETIAVPAIAPLNRNVIILDEIGKMECFSEAFKQAAITALNSRNIVVGTITFGGDDCILGMKNREDIEIHEVTPDNRDELPAMT